MKLTKRQAEIIKHICLGKTNKEIAKVLKIQEATIKYHIFILFEKLGVSSRSKIISKFVDQEKVKAFIKENVK